MPWKWKVFLRIVWRRLLITISREMSRELKNLLESIFVNQPYRVITFQDLPELFRKRLQETEDLPKDERTRLLSALFTTNWNKSQAAQELNWSRKTLYRKMAKYNITKSRTDLM